ncbi:hypothetical protein V8F33_001919 [Rhypophila sp. PSN 637]|uniref:Uncharacterized protein n=1 Tax=Rhypophila decipiens TaxID=261697 RepID=A0AAN7B7E5_9PEZI|nr:hypothetical protein QBC37DRAFT_422777 [Rhypophila decipiens]
MFTTLVRRMASSMPNLPKKPAKPEPFFPLKKVWPPDFKQMSVQQQLRFEKRYKRRLRHISQRPGWDKGVQIAQFITISAVVVYSALFMEWADGSYQPLTGFRTYVYDLFGFKYNPPPLRERTLNPLHPQNQNKDL